jgi:hypothetical protein
VTRIAALLVLAALTATFAPTARNLAATSEVRRPDRHAAFVDGAYLLSEPEVVRSVSHLPASVAVARILLAWDGRDAHEPGGVDLAGTEDLAATLRGHGFAGSWRALAAEAVDGVPSPFVAVLNTATGPVPVIVRDAYAGHTLVTHPRRGNLMYPRDELEERWPGRAFVLNHPPPAPEFWR